MRNTIIPAGKSSREGNLSAIASVSPGYHWKYRFAWTKAKSYECYGILELYP